MKRWLQRLICNRFGLSNDAVLSSYIDKITQQHLTSHTFAHFFQVQGIYLCKHTQWHMWITLNSRITNAKHIAKNSSQYVNIFSFEFTYIWKLVYLIAYRTTHDQWLEKPYSCSDLPIFFMFLGVPLIYNNI